MNAQPSLYLHALRAQIIATLAEHWHNERLRRSLVMLLSDVETELDIPRTYAPRAERRRAVHGQKEG